MKQAIVEKQIDVGNVLRPRSFKNFIGQTRVTKNLQLYIQAAVQRNDVLDHTLISGSPGLGKTTLASLIAQGMKADLKITSAPIITQPKDLIGMLVSLDAQAILFIDEIHRLRPQVEEVLYSAMENYTLDWIVGKGIESRIMRIPISPFTLVGATTQVGKLSSPLLSRFGIREELSPYSIRDLCAIIKNSSALMNIEITDDATKAIARVSRQTPRTANALLCRVRDFSQIRGEQSIDLPTVLYACQQMDIDQNGLEATDRRILKLLTNVYKGKPAGLKAIASSINEAELSIEEYREPFLIQNGFIQRTARGRCATDKAFLLYGQSDGE